MQTLKRIHLVLFAALAGFLLIQFVRTVDTPRSGESNYLVVVDRTNFMLRLFEREDSLLDQLKEDEQLRLVRAYPIAVGAAGYDTPSGLRHVIYKEKNPSWQAPNRPWAGDLAGQTIPYGDPRNPIKARFIGLGEGIGIHGTAEKWSIGGRASHGCIRMRVRDIQPLYERVSIGTPILVR